MNEINWLGQKTKKIIWVVWIVCILATILMMSKITVAVTNSRIVLTFQIVLISYKFLVLWILILIYLWRREIFSIYHMITKKSDTKTV